MASQKIVSNICGELYSFKSEVKTYHDRFIFSKLIDM